MRRQCVSMVKSVLFRAVHAFSIVYKNGYTRPITDSVHLYARTCAWPLLPPGGARVTLSDVYICTRIKLIKSYVF